MDFSLNWIYIAISWIVLRWHQVWAMVFDAKSDIAWILAIIFLVITLRALLFPIFVKQIKSQRKFQEIQPRLMAIREKHKNDRQTAAVETQKVMRETGANPLMGCLPIFIQLPFFFGIFHVLRHINPESNNALRAMTEEYGWSVSQFHAASDAKLFGAPIAAAFNSSSSFLDTLGADRTNVRIVAAVLVLIMVVSQYITARQMIARSKATASSDDSTARAQQTMQKVMLYGLPLSLLISGAIFPIGVVLYQVVNNLFSMVQQFWVIKKMPHPNAATEKREISPEAAKALAPKPGVKPNRDKKKVQQAKGPQGDGAANKSTAAKKPKTVAATVASSQGGSEKSRETNQPSKGTSKSDGSAGSRSKKGKKGRKGGRI